MSIASSGDVNSLKSLKKMNDPIKLRSHVIETQRMFLLPRIHTAPDQAEEEEDN